MPEITVKPVTVHGGSTSYDVCLNGKPINGSRHDRKHEAEAEAAQMRRALGGRHA